MQIFLLGFDEWRTNGDNEEVPMESHINKKSWLTPKKGQLKEIS
jgi:hypothetical protein